jgi:hypothetical protein
MLQRIHGDNNVAIKYKYKKEIPSFCIGLSFEFDLSEQIIHFSFKNRIHTVKGYRPNLPEKLCISFL